MWSMIQFLLLPFMFHVLRLPIFQSDYVNSTFLKLTEIVDDNTIQYTNLTGFEKNQIHQLREIMGDELKLDFEKCDDFLLRWLQDCDMDLTCTSEKLKYALKWRRSTLLEIMEPNKTFLTARQDPTHIHGRAKDGGPVMVYTMTGWDVRKLALTGNRENLLKHQIQVTESYFQASIKRSGNGEVKLIPGIVVGNSQAFSLKPHGCVACMRIYKDMADINDKHYPRTSRFITIINAPGFGKPLLELVHSFLNPYSQTVFQIFGNEKEEWSSFLLKHISKEELSEELGGSRARKIYTE